MSSELPPPPPSIDAVASNRLTRQSITQSPWLHEEVGKRMSQRLQWMKQSMNKGLDWHPLNGGTQSHLLLKQHNPAMQWWACESTPQRERQAKHLLQTDTPKKANWFKAKWSAISHAPKAETKKALKATLWQSPEPASMDMLWANMSLHTSSHPLALLQQWREYLAVNGMLMFSCLGPDTLIEIRNIYQEHNWPPACHDFTDMHDWGDMLIAAGFTEPVMDVERITLSYTEADVLLRDLKQWGHNLHHQRFPALRGKKWLAQLKKAIQEKIEQQYEQGGMRLTFEIIYGHAIQASPRIAVKDTSQISLQDMKKMLQQKPSP